MAGVSPLVAPTTEQVPVTPEPVPVRPLVPALRVLEPVPQPEAANVLSPTQVRTFLDCSAKWWFRYGLRLPEPKTSSLALGSAVHEALAENFRQKVETREDLDVCGVTVLFRQDWSRQTEEAVFQPLRRWERTVCAAQNRAAYNGRTWPQFPSLSPGLVRPCSAAI